MEYQELEAVILLGRGSYGGGVGEVLERVTDTLRETGRWPVVREAVVDRGGPSFPEALSGCARSGVSRVLVVPVSFSIEPALLAWLKKVAARWRVDRARAPEVIFAGTPLRGRAVAELVRRAACEAGAGKRVEGRDAAVTAGGRRALEDPLAWSEIPSHERHVLVCTGPRCTARGAGRLWRHLRRELRERRLEDDGAGAGRVLVAQAGCLYPCNLGPTMVVYPEGVWYGVSGPRAVERIVADHLVGGGVAGAYALATGCCGGGEESGSGVFQRTVGEVAR